MTTNFGSAPLVLTTTLVKHPSRPGRGGRSLVRMLPILGTLSRPASSLVLSFSNSIWMRAVQHASRHPARCSRRSVDRHRGGRTLLQVVFTYCEAYRAQHPQPCVFFSIRAVG